MTSTAALVRWQDTSCSRCADLVAWNAERNVVKASPCPPGGLLAVGEAPGADENRLGVGFVGKAGEKLRGLLKGCDLGTDEYGCANVCRCQPPKNREPTRQEVTFCVPYLAKLIKELRPKVILAVGGRTAAAMLCGRGALHEKLTAGWKSEDWSAKPELAHEGLREALATVSFVVPMPHTSSRVMNGRAPNGQGWATIAERQVALAVKLLKKS